MSNYLRTIRIYENKKNPEPFGEGFLLDRLAIARYNKYTSIVKVMQ